MPAQESMAFVRRFVEEVINGANLDLAGELVAPTTEPRRTAQ